jgi:hypothetical protein
MGTQVTLTIGEELYERARRLAEERGMNVEEVLATVLDATGDAMASLVPEANDVLDREREAYVALHPKLWPEYEGRHVAIYRGELIDHDRDFGALYERIVARYPDEFVWLTKVQKEPIPTLVFRSPRLVRDDE